MQRQRRNSKCETRPEAETRDKARSRADGLKPSRWTQVEPMDASQEMKRAVARDVLRHGICAAARDM